MTCCGMEGICVVGFGEKFHKAADVTSGKLLLFRVWNVKVHTHRMYPTAVEGHVPGGGGQGGGSQSRPGLIWSQAVV